MYKIAICDDEKYELNSINSLLEEWAEGYENTSVKLTSYSSGKSLLNGIWEYGTYDIYILDVIMPDMNGIELGARIRQSDNSGIIIYLTTASEFAVDSYEVGAFFYLLKPINKQKLFEVLGNAVGKLDKKKQNTYRIRTRDNDEIVSYDDIYYVEQSDRFPHYVCTDKTIVGLMLKKAFKDEMRELLDAPEFIMCGASYIVNLSHIKAVDKSSITLSNSKTLTLPKSSIRALRIEWTNFWLD